MGIRSMWSLLDDYNGTILCRQPLSRDGSQYHMGYISTGNQEGELEGGYERDHKHSNCLLSNINLLSICAGLLSQMSL